MDNVKEKIRKWREDPVFFVTDQFGVTPDKWQEKALRAFGSQSNTKVRLALKACVGPGKTAVLAWMAWNFLACYGERGNHPKGACVSITSDNLSMNLWPELQKWRGVSPFLMETFEWTKEKVFCKRYPATWFLGARSWSKDANPDEQGNVLSGLHSKYVLALIDESGDIPLSILKKAEQALSNADCEFGRIVQAGNPTSKDGALYHASTLARDKWTIITITGDPDNPERSPRIDLEWAKDQIKSHGRDNPWVMAHVLGEFPDSAINSLLSIEDLERATNRPYRPEEYEYAQKRLGIDVARFGLDATVIFPRQGLVAFTPVIMRNARSQEIAARIAVAKAKFESEIEFVDATGGYGAGVCDALIQTGYAPIEVQFAGKSSDPRFFNKRAEIWWNMAEWVKRGGSIPDNANLKKALSVTTYTLQNGKFRIEEKDQIKKRLAGFSPDEADALATTFALPEAPAMFKMPGGVGLPIVRAIQGQVVTEYDPFADDAMTR